MMGLKSELFTRVEGQDRIDAGPGGQDGLLWRRDGVLVKRGWWPEVDLNVADRVCGVGRSDPGRRFLERLGEWVGDLFSVGGGGSPLKRGVGDSGTWLPGMVEPGGWSQGGGYVVVGVCLGDCTVENVPLEWIPGTHAWGAWVGKDLDFFTEAAVGEMKIERGRDPVVTFQGVRGDMVVLHPCLLRRNGESVDGVLRDRPMLFCRYIVVDKKSEGKVDED